jgi:hypothetical protein
MDRNGSVDVLEERLVESRAGERNLVPDLFEYGPANADSRRLRERLDSRRDIYGVSDDIGSLVDYVAEVNPNPHIDSVRVGSLVALEQPPLHRDGALRRIQRALKFDEECIPECFDFSSAVLSEKRAKESLGLREQA